MRKRGGSVLVQINPVQQLSRIAPGSFFGFTQCKLREVYAASGNPGLLPSYPSAYFGKAVHKLFEMASKGHIQSTEYIVDAWNKCLSEAEQELFNNEQTRHLLPLKKFVKQYEVKKRQLIRTAASLLQRKRSSTQKFFSGNERWIESEDQTIGGVVDKIVWTVDGYEIVDYKTGDIFEPTGIEIKSQYKNQLMLYAVTLYENTHEWPVSLKIIELNGTVHSLTFSTEDCLNLKKQAGKILEDINSSLYIGNYDLEMQQALLANPKRGNCTFCRYRPACSPYWKKRSKSVEDWPFDVTGEFVDVTRLGNGTELLKIKHNNKIYRIRGLQPSRHNIVPKKYYAVYNLLPDNVENCYKEGPMTTIFTF